jgi:hypothetical protein
MKKILLVTQEELVHKKNEIAEMVSSNLTREFTQAPREFIQVPAEATRTKASYRPRGIHPAEPLRGEEKKEYES